MKVNKVYISFICLIFLLTCKKAVYQEAKKINTNYIQINIEIGSHYFLKKFKILKSNHRPQIVIWLEDENNHYIDTLYMTQKGAKSLWGDANIQRPSCFPVWAYSRAEETEPGYFMPTRKNQLPDSITSATPGNDFTVSWPIPDNLSSGKYQVKLEINSSYDYNKYYSHKDNKNINYHPFNGQPSLIWTGILNINDRIQKTDLHITGHGDVKGQNGNIHHDLNKITTAKKMLKQITVFYFP